MLVFLLGEAAAIRLDEAQIFRGEKVNNVQ